MYTANLTKAIRKTKITEVKTVMIQHKNIAYQEDTNKQTEILYK